MDYWRKRQLQLLELEYKDALKELRKIYKVATDRIAERLLKTYNEICEDGSPLVSKLYQYNRYYRLLKELQNILRDLGVQEEKILTQHMEDVYKHNFDSLGEKLPPAPPVQKEVIDRLIHEDWIGDGDNFSDRIWKNKALMAKKAKDFIMLAIAEGKSPTAFIEDLEPYLQKQGLWRAKRLLVTEMAHTQYVSTIDRYKTAGVDKVEILTADDNKVCAKCDEASSMTYQIDDCPILPLHP